MITGTLCRRRMATITSGDTLRTAARRMEDEEVGTLVVVHPGNAHHAVGMVTDRDLAVRCVAKGIDPDTTPVSEVMSSPVHTIDQDAPLEFALNEMADAATRRLVVTGKDHQAVGIISLDDLLGLLCEQAGTLGRLLRKQRPLIAV